VPSDSVDHRARLTIALPPLDAAAHGRAVDEGWHLELLNAEDPDERSVLILLAHPELDDTIREGKETVVVGGEEMNPRLHLAVHEVVATQIIENDPPEALQTAQRLLRLGRDHHEVLHMLGFVVSGQIWGAMHERREYSRAEHVRALEALPQPFDAELARPPDRAARRAHARRGRRGHGR